MPKAKLAGADHAMPSRAPRWHESNRLGENQPATRGPLPVILNHKLFGNPMRWYGSRSPERCDHDPTAQFESAEDHGREQVWVIHKIPRLARAIQIFANEHSFTSPARSCPLSIANFACLR